jgi:uncharacterized SAM-binding protein YcdF (DUF218 family)
VNARSALPLAAATAGLAAAGLTSRRIRRDGRGQPLEPADALLVFGATVWPTGPSLSLSVRVARAAQVYAGGWAPTVVCSGGRSNGASEAQVMRRLLVERGLPAEAIVPDDGGVTTREAIRSVRRFGGGRWRRVIAVSSPYHLHRIACEARRQRLDVVLCPASRPGPRTPRLLAFDVRQHLREVMAVPSYAASWQAEQALERGWGRIARSAAVHIAARGRSFLGEVDAIADASEAIARRIKESAGASEAHAALTPAAAALEWPLAGPVRSAFGLRHRRLHAGIDIAADYGSPVRAAAPGQIALAGWLGPFGNLLAVEHGGGLATVYAHLAGYVVEQGSTVERGELLGYVGTTGRSFGPHLHFEVRAHGTPVDPLAYLQ